MSWAAWEKQCLTCARHAALKAGKVSFQDRGCPEDTRRGYKGRKISPQHVLENMRSDWRCPERVPLSANGAKVVPA